MSDDGEEEEEVFIDAEGLGVLSRAAFQLHSFAVMNSIRDGHPGFVSDDYLNAIAAETTTTAVELEVAGIWERRDDGYFIVVDDMVRWAIDFNEASDRRHAECQERGEHVDDPEGDKSGWVICTHCGVPLKRPDGGPVALPNGGPLGPDTRTN